jgi:hypothetical protein
MLHPAVRIRACLEHRGIIFPERWKDVRRDAGRCGFQHWL